MAIIPPSSSVPLCPITLRWTVPAPGELPAPPEPPAAPPPEPPALPLEIQSIVAAALAWQVRRWQRAGEPHYVLSLAAAQTMWKQAADEILPDEDALRVSASGLCQRLSIEVERVVRVLAVPASSLQPGILDAEMRAAALAGICRRIGQLFRLFCQRFGWDGALLILWHILTG